MLNNSAALASAVALAREGFHCFPCLSDKRPACSGGFYAATCDEEKLKELFSRTDAVLVGVRAGEESDICVVDVDGMKPGTKLTDEELEQFNAFMDTFASEFMTARCVRTMNGGLHYYFRHREGLRPSAGVVAPGIDIRAEGSYVIAPNGENYIIANDAAIKPMPEVLYNFILAAKSKKTSGAVLTFPKNTAPSGKALIRTGKRNDTLFSLGIYHRKKGKDAEQVLEELARINQQCDEPLDTEEVEKIAASVSRYSTAQEDSNVLYREMVRNIEQLPEGDSAGGKLLIPDIHKLDAVDADLITLRLAKKIGVSTRAIKSQLETTKPEEDSGGDSELTHHDICVDYVAHIFQKTKQRPVTDLGESFSFNEASGLWEPKAQLSVEFAGRYNDCKRCQTAAQYDQIARHFADLTLQENFFSSAPVGVAAGDTFYTVDQDGVIGEEPLAAHHKRRFKLPVAPCEMEVPKWDMLVGGALAGEDSRGQTLLLQQIIGAAVLGLLPAMQRAALLVGVGRSGKSTIAEIIRAMFPLSSVGAVAPDRWDSEYYLAQLAGVALNVVGELSQDKPIPSAPYKNVIGRDPITGRHPCGRPFYFVNQAAHIFCSNHFVPTRERSYAFFERWACVRFFHEIPEERRIKGLGAQIIAEELPGVLHWALQGAASVMANGYRFSLTASHEQAIADWLDNASSVAEFLQDGDWVKPGDFFFKADRVYEHYSEWCKVNNKKPLGRNHFYQEVDYCSRLGFERKRDRVKGLVIRGIAELKTSNRYTPPLLLVKDFVEARP